MTAACDGGVVLVFIFVVFVLVLFVVGIMRDGSGWGGTGRGRGFALACQLRFELRGRSGRPGVAGWRFAFFRGLGRGFGVARVVGAFAAPLTVDLVGDRWGNRENLLG